MALRSLLILIAGVVMSQFYRSHLAVLGPELARDLGAGPADLGNLSGIWFLAFALAQIPVGVALDHFGIRRTVTTALGLAVAGAAMFTLAGSVAMALAAQVVLGMACAPLYMAVVVLIARAWPRERFAAVSGTVLAATNLGMLVSASPLAALVGWLGWRGAFGLMTAATLATVIAVVLGVREPPMPPRRENLVQAVRGTVSLIGLKALWPLFPYALIAPAVLIAVRTLWAGPYLDEVYGMAPLDRGHVLGLMVLAGALAAAVLGWLQYRMGSRRVATASSVAGIAVLVALGAWPAAGVAVTVALLCGVAFFGATYGMMMAQGRLFIPEGREGRGITLLNFFSFLGMALIQAASGRLVATAQSAGLSPEAIYRLLFLALAGLLAAAVIVYQWSKDRP